MHLSQMTPEGWAFLTLAFTTICGGIGWSIRRWADRRLAASKEEAKKASDTAATLAATQERLIDAAERRENEAIKRTDDAIASIGKLTNVVTELVAINRATLEEVKRANANVDYLTRDRQQR